MASAFAAAVAALLLVTPVAALQCKSRALPSRQSSRSGCVRAFEPGDLVDILSQSPIIVNRMEVLDPDKGMLTPITGVTVTPSGYLGLVFVVLGQLFAPWGWVKYSKRLRDDEQAWLDEGVDEAQAVINALQNVRPPQKGAGGEQTAAGTTTTSERADQTDRGAE